MSATFLYDAEGNRVKGTVAGVTTVYPSTRLRAGLAGLYEYQNGTVKSRGTSTTRYGGNRGGKAVFSGITTKRFTGQYYEQGLPGGEGLAFYNRAGTMPS